MDKENRLTRIKVYRIRYLFDCYSDHRHVYLNNFSDKRKFEFLICNTM